MKIIILLFSALFFLVSCNQKVQETPREPASSTTEVAFKKYQNCVTTGYYSKNPKIKDCDFKDIRVSMSDLFRTCNMELMNSGIEMTRLVQMTKEFSEKSLSALNAEINKLIISCGCEGTIEYTATGGKSKVFCGTTGTKATTAPDETVE